MKHPCVVAIEKCCNTNFLSKVERVRSGLWETFSNDSGYKSCGKSGLIAFVEIAVYNLEAVLGMY